MATALQFLPVTTELHSEQVAELARIIWEEHYPPITGMAQTRYMLANYQSSAAIFQQIQDGVVYYLLYAADQAIGYFALLNDPQLQQVKLSKLYLLKAYRGQNYGQEMLQFIKLWSRTMGAESIWLTVNRQNVSAIEFYTKNGFLMVGELLQAIGEGFVMDDYKMQLNLILA